VFVNDADCDKTKLPIVFVHGTVANADSFAYPAQLFASNGYCPERIRGIEYHSLIGTVAGDGGFTLDQEATYADAKRAIDAQIAQLRAELGVEKVDLAGHSQGARHGARYTQENPDKVAHYINLAGADLPADPSGVPTLNLSSVGDRPANSNTTANVVFQDRWLDHSAVASSTESFVEMYKFLNAGQAPTFSEVQCGTPILLEGKARTFADNQPLPGSRVDVFELPDDPRERGAPVQSFTLDQSASFGPFEAKPGVAYEFELTPPPGDAVRKPSHSYLPPFLRSDRLLRFNFQTQDRVAGATSMRINRHASMAVLIPRNRRYAFLAERDTLTVDGREVLTRTNTLTASPNTTPVVRSSVIAAIYLYDQSLTPGYGPGDMQSTGAPIVTGAFTSSADLFLQATTPRFIEVRFNGRTLRIPNWPSDSEGSSLVFVN
jgi:pimeloyl-ACP methyl ester carboxylesterase